MTVPPLAFWHPDIDGRVHLSGAVMVRPTVLSRPLPSDGPAHLSGAIDGPPGSGWRWRAWLTESKAIDIINTARRARP